MTLIPFDVESDTVARGAADHAEGSLSWKLALDGIICTP
jgi:hypothetical protein